MKNKWQAKIKKRKIRHKIKAKISLTSSKYISLAFESKIN